MFLRFKLKAHKLSHIYWYQDKIFKDLVNVRRQIANTCCWRSYID